MLFTTFANIAKENYTWISMSSLWISKMTPVQLALNSQEP